LVKLRLARMGNRKRPFYRVVAADEMARRDGRFIEIVGTYDPLANPSAIDVKSDIALKWLASGAQPTDTVKRILAKSGVWAHWRAVQAGEAELGGMTDRVVGSIERGRAVRPSKKTIAKIAEDEKAKAEAAAAPAEEPAVEGGEG